MGTWGISSLVFGLIDQKKEFGFKHFPPNSENQTLDKT